MAGNEFRGYRPLIDGSGEVGYRHDKRKPFSAADGSSNPKSYGFRLSQPIFNGFSTTNAVSEAEALVRAGQQDLRVQEQTVLLDAVTAYMDVVKNQENVRLAESNLNFLTEELKATQDRFAVGEVTKTDVAQSEARKASATSQLDFAKAQLKTSRANYERVIGHPPERLVKPMIPKGLLPATLDEAKRIAAQESPAVVAQLYREQAARFRIDAIRGTLLPQVSVNATYDDGFDLGVLTDREQNAAVTGRVDLPIYDGGLTYSQVRQAKQQHLSQLQLIEDARSRVEESVVAAWSSFVAATAQIVSDKAQVEANKIALEGVREEERVGQRTLIDVLDAQREYITSQVQLVATERNNIVASYTLLQAIGRLEVAMLGVTGTVYDPEVHYGEVRRKWFGISITHADGREEFLDTTPAGEVVPVK
jgi:outer membrane protein